MLTKLTFHFGAIRSWLNVDDVSSRCGNVLRCERMGKDNQGLFGLASAYAQACGLFSVAFAMGLIFGPIYAGAIFEKINWQVAVCALAGFCVSGSIPIVSDPRLE